MLLSPLGFSGFCHFDKLGVSVSLGFRVRVRVGFKVRVRVGFSVRVRVGFRVRVSLVCNID